MKNSCLGIYFLSLISDNKLKKVIYELFMLKIIMSQIVCIPAFDEEKNIERLVIESLKYVDKVLVCDDGSSDNTAEKSRKAGAIVISHEKNMGKGVALKSLFEEARKLNPDIVVTIDGDGQFLPEEIPKLISPIIEKNVDIVIGNRFIEKNQIPSYRKFGNTVLDKITSAASELPFNDTQSGFRAYSKKALESINFSSKGFAADSEILINASKHNLKISEVPVAVIYDTGSRTSTKNPVTHSSSVIGTLLELVAMKHPLLCLGLPGFVLVSIGILYSVIVITIFNEARFFSIPSTLVSLGSLIIGLMLIMMAVILFTINRINERTN